MNYDSDEKFTYLYLSFVNAWLLAIVSRAIFRAPGLETEITH